MSLNCDEVETRFGESKFLILISHSKRDNANRKISNFFRLKPLKFSTMVMTQNIVINKGTAEISPSLVSFS